MALFESYDRRIDKINAVLAEYGIASVEEAKSICEEKGFSPYDIVKGIQSIAFENAGWAYTAGAAIAVKTDTKKAADAAETERVKASLQARDRIDSSRACAPLRVADGALKIDSTRMTLEEVVTAVLDGLPPGWC